MPFVTALFSGATPYIAGILLLIAVGAGGFGLWERSEAAAARAQVASQAATINEQQATLAADAKAIADLQRIKDLDESVIATTANQEVKIRSTLSQAEAKVTHVKVTDCQSPDARDAAALGGLRGILGAVPATPAPDPDQGGQGTASSGPSGLPAAAGNAGAAAKP